MAWFPMGRPQLHLSRYTSHRSGSSISSLKDKASEHEPATTESSLELLFWETIFLPQSVDGVSGCAACSWDTSFRMQFTPRISKEVPAVPSPVCGRGSGTVGSDSTFCSAMTAEVLEESDLRSTDTPSARWEGSPSRTGSFTAEWEDSAAARSLSRSDRTILAMDHLLSLLITRIKAPFSSFNRWFSCFIDSNTWNQTKTFRFIGYFLITTLLQVNKHYFSINSSWSQSHRHK